MNKLKKVFSATIIGSMAFVALLSIPRISLAQNYVDATSGFCEDSACSRNRLAAPPTSNSNSSTSVAAENICHPSSTANPAVACGYGFSGTKFTTTTVTCVKGAYGGKTTKVSGYDTSSCVQLPVTCTVSETDVSGSCGSGYTGRKYRTRYVSCPSGIYSPPSTSYSSWDSSECEAVVVTPPPVVTPPVVTPPVTPPVVTPPVVTDPPTTGPVTCTPGSWTNSAACGSGYSGTMTSVSTQTCPSGIYGSPSVSTSGYNTSGCGCSNGAVNYPTCSIAVPPKGCPYAGDVAWSSCDFVASGSQGGADCIEGDYVWSKSVYKNDAACSTEVIDQGSTGGMQGYCPGRHGGSCPAGY